MGLADLLTVDSFAGGLLVDNVLKSELELDKTEVLSVSEPDQESKYWGLMTGGEFVSSFSFILTSLETDRIPLTASIDIKSFCKIWSNLMMLSHTSADENNSLWRRKICLKFIKYSLSSFLSSPAYSNTASFSFDSKFLQSRKTFAIWKSFSFSTSSFFLFLLSFSFLAIEKLLFFILSFISLIFFECLFFSDNFSCLKVAVLSFRCLIILWKCLEKGKTN